MIIEFILAILLGVIIGTITGLTPGIHTNLVAATLVSLVPFLPGINNILIIVFIVSVAITNTFVDFIPSIYLGAPDEDTALSTLPGHQFLIQGKGHQAVVLTLIGSSISIIIFIFLLPLLTLTLPKIYPFLERMMAWLLIWVSILLLLHEKESKTRAMIVFIMAGFLGIISLNSNTQQPILPLLTGLFGSSTLIYSIKSKIKIPEQIIEKINFRKKDLIKPVITTAIVSPICSFLPGIGSSQAAVIGSEIVSNQTKEQFLILLGSINTLVMSVSFLTLYLIDKSRSGVASSISQITSMTPYLLGIIILTIILSSLISIPLTIKLSKIFGKNISKINYGKLSIGVLILLGIIVFIFSSFNGLIIFITSTLIGMLCIELQVRRSFLMGSLLIPTIIFYLPI